MAEAQFRVTVGSDVESPHVVADGEIDLANVSQFQDVMAKATTGSATLTVDLSQVSYCDSAAVRALFAVAASTDLTMIVAAEGPIKTLLGISGLDRVATVVTEE
ncbi:STAS domain-containing protein [Mycolicibacterium sp. P1-5]|uniref:STAS domain-containing protein n=1 Tax=Mycolicibacterium sp. P1-5 TaxID=2024617 RepID=UPI0011F01CE6|nr:STAS domain-containing protein [Mycolicibacterium sp. P1-5]KAA0108453.1 anti-sigma factor antagonist [Mycolicibacterium sp. P1-5]